MLPYTQLQLIYLVLSGVAAAGVFWAAGRTPALRGSLILRLFAAEALLGGLGVIAFVYLSKQFTITQAFGAVAVVFYGGALWLPIFALLSARRGTQARIGGVLAALLVLGVGADAFFVESNRLVLREERLPLAGWEGKPFRLVHISDQQTVGECARERAAVEMINGLKPDLIVVTGDFVSGPWSDPGPAIEAARKFHGSLKARLGVVLVPGHSEPEHIRMKVIDGLDVIYLKNQTRRFPMGDGRDLVLYGMDAIIPKMPPPDLRKKPNDFVLVASHVPDYTVQLAPLDIDLHLAGHTHGGQIVIPGFGPPLTLSKLPREYARGMRRFGEHWINVTSGIGMEGHHAPRIRFQCPPEVTLIRLGGGQDSVPPTATKD